MFRVKKLYLFILQTFLPLFLMTFLICLFIVLMQFLWKYVDDLVGKGLELSVIAELFCYAALTMVPLALPLAILLASLMVFGNLGEKFELTAMKAAGVSLIRIMSPLIVCVSIVAVAAFFFQNDVLPKAQVKMWTLLFSMRQKSPELDIPEGAFYDQIDGYNIYIREKNKENGHLYDMKIYDVSKGGGSANIIVADSGKLSFSEDKMNLFLRLWSGESFEDLKSNSGMRGNFLYRRETFSSKEIIIPFDANFNRMDDETMRNQYVGKNISELQHTIDSVNARVDSIGSCYANDLRMTTFFNVPSSRFVRVNDKLTVERTYKPVKVVKKYDIDSIFHETPFVVQRSIVTNAIGNARRMRQDYEFKSYSMDDDMKTIRRHGIELQKKFTLAIACLVFFFIGAPLGSIIRKGGLAVPIVVSVLLFVFYYIIDNSGIKLAREGVLEVWEGVWLSTAVLLPLGIFVTYKAVNDSAVFNADAYINLFRKIIGQAEIRHLEVKEFSMNDVVPADGIEMLEKLKTEISSFLNEYPKRQRYVKYFAKGYPIERILAISEQLEAVVTYLSDSKDVLIVNKLMDFPVLRKLFFYRVTNIPAVGYLLMALLPVGIVIYLIGQKQQSILKKDIKTIVSVSNELISILEKQNITE